MTKKCNMSQPFVNSEGYCFSLFCLLFSNCSGFEPEICTENQTVSKSEEDRKYEAEPGDIFIHSQMEFMVTLSCAYSKETTHKIDSW